MDNHVSVTDCDFVRIGADAGTTLIIALICACLIISSAMPLCVALHFKKEKAVKMPPVPVEPPAGESCHGVDNKRSDKNSKIIKCDSQLFSV